VGESGVVLDYVGMDVAEDSGSVFGDGKCNRPADGVRFPASEYYYE
jgi:hypothetical protein